jgi:DNA modification methylase
LEEFAPLFKKFLKSTGSIVVEVGNAWQQGKPIMTTLALESLLAFRKKGDLHLCQQFIWHNPARLPTPAQWVTVERIRVKDSFTHLWWMSPSERPKADNRRILVEYSQSMKQLLKKGVYNSGRRPSEHRIGATSFLSNNKGAIPPNVLSLDMIQGSTAESVVTLANTQANTDYQTYCKKHKIEPHPARMPSRLAQFFIKFLTEPGDLVMDPFAGSNTTGAAAEVLERRWVAIEPNKNYVRGSKGRFKSLLP